jgi:hypothetical protein
MSFTEKLDEKSLAAFSTACKKPFSEQAQFFLNAFWDEYGDQAENIYSVAWEVIKRADMRVRNVTYVHLYEEGADLDFDMGLYFFEQLCKFYDEPKPTVINGLVGPDWRTNYPKSCPKEMTAVHRKKELRDKVDVNFDGRVSFIEYLLYQYEASPKDLMDRSTAAGALPEEVLNAMRALEEVNKRVKAYETEKARLEELSAGTGIKALGAKNELAQLLSSPLWEQINKALITAEAAVRIARKKFGVNSDGSGGSGGTNVRTNGTMWWLERELKTKKEKYGAKSKQ